MEGSAHGERLAGRAAESALLRDAVAQTTAGRCGAIWIEGAPGIGKTRMLGTLTDAARRSGLRIATAPAEEFERLRPFGVLARALDCHPSAADPRRARIAALIRTHEHSEQGTITVTTDPGLQFRAVEAFADLVEELATSEPMLLALDDLQWADASTLLALTEILRRMTGMPLLVAGGFRGVDDASALQSVMNSAAASHAVHVRLSPLTPAGVRELVEDILGADPGPRLFKQLGVADGNPLFIAELVAELKREGALHRRGDTVELGAPTASAPLRIMVLRRVSRLPVQVVDVLRTASILGSSFAPTDLATITAQPMAELIPALTAARDAHILEERGDELAFRHDLIRQAIYEDNPAGVLVALHRDAATRLAAAGAPPETVATQLLHSASPGDADAVAWVLRAARDAASSFPSTGADLFARGLELMDAADPARRETMVEHADALMSARRIPEAVSVCHAVLERGRPDHAEAGALARLGAALVVTGSPREALDHLRRVADHPGADDQQRAAAAADAATAELWLGDLDRCERWARRAQEHATGDAAVVGAIATRSVISTLKADFPRALTLSETALQTSAALEGASAQQYPLHATRGFLLLEVDRFGDARAELDLGRERSESAGVLWPLPTYQAYLGVERFLCGHWDDAISELETSVTLIDDSGISFAATTAHTVMAVIRIHRGDLTGAAHALDAAADALALGPRHARYRLAHARALLADAEGDADAASALLVEAWHGCVSDGVAMDIPWLAPDLVGLALGEGSVDLAERVTATFAELDGASAAASHRAALLRCQGLIADDPATLTRSVDQYAVSGRTLETALTQEQAAVSQSRHGRSDEARELFAAARLGLESLRADHDLRRLDARMRDAGMSPGKRGARTRPSIGWESLTDTERLVADLVGEGLTNPQIGTRLFISRRTVQTHVSHIFAKLDLTSRAQLAALVAGHRGR